MISKEICPYFRLRWCVRAGVLMLQQWTFKRVLWEELSLGWPDWTLCLSTRAFKRHCGKNTRYSLSALKVYITAPQDIPFLTGSIVSQSVILMAQIPVCGCCCVYRGVVVRTHELHLTNQVSLNNNFIITVLILLSVARTLLCWLLRMACNC